MTILMVISLLEKSCIHQILTYNVFAISPQEPSLVTLEQMAVPLEAALSNGKPTVMEFYANW
jgi:hypothetical protein